MDNSSIQAGLSRATLEISSKFSSYFPLRAFIVYALWSPQSDGVVAENSNFQYFEVVFHWRLSSLEAIFNFGLVPLE